MPNDATFEIMAGLTDKQSAAISLIAAPTWNIDDMDPRFCMVNLMFSGMYCLMSSKEIDPKRPGMVYIDGKETEAPMVPPPMPVFGQMIGVKARKYVKEYNRSYAICYTGAYDTDGMEIPDFSFTLTTMPRRNPGEIWPEHDTVVLEAARESAVLLKNENHTLPLGSYAVANVFGAGAVVFRSGCLGAGKINPRYSIRVKEGIEHYSSLELNEELYDFYTSEEDVLPPDEMLKRAREKNDTAIVFLSRTSSEAHDNLPKKGGYYLTDEEKSLINGVTKVFSRTVAVLNVAYPIETGWMEQVDAVLLVGLPGMAGGRALAELLEGTQNPSGKLACTWAKDYWDYPSAKNFLTLSELRKRCPDAKFVTTVYEEGLYVGYRYFDTFGKEPAFRFGHGLSYTSFEKTVVQKDDATIEVTVTNTGNISGKEVVSLYAKLPEEKLEQPNRRLVSFAKTKELAPKENETLVLKVTDERLQSFDELSGSWLIEVGEIEFYLDNEKVGSRRIPETVTVGMAGARIPAPLEIKELSKHDIEGTYPLGKDTKGHAEDTLPFSVYREFPEEQTEFSGVSSHSQNLKCSMPSKESKDLEVITFTDVVNAPSKAEAFIAQMSDYEMARLTVGGKTGWGMADKGYAGMLSIDGALEKYKLPEYFFSDGNNGLNLFEPNIGFPVSATMCASWNEELMYKEGVAIAEEAKAMGMSCLLAPALNLQRNILCGRHTEYFSEDPLLAGRMAGQENRGFEETGVSGSMKHFFANNAETHRGVNHSLMTERTARELYLAAFAYAFEVKKPDTVMTGYNAANGMFCANDGALLNGILRKEWGFEGYVMTDWNGYGNLGMQGLVQAGISWVAPGCPDDSLVTPIVEAIANGTLSRGRLQKNLVDLVRVIIKCRKNTFSANSSDI